MKLFIFILVTLISLKAFSFEEFSVKVTSFPCNEPNWSKVQENGSGTLINKEGTIYVLSSDHVVYHGNTEEGFCHKIIMNNASSYSAELVSADITKGLSLLKILNTKESMPALDFKNLLSLKNKCDISPHEKKLVSHGYTLQDSSFISGQGELINSKSRRHLIPLVEEMYEVQVFSEFGMSGGGVFENNEYAGNLSHQYRIVPIGKPSFILEKPPTYQNNLIALVIPRCTVLEWLNDAFSGAANFRLDPQSQVFQRQRIIIDHVKFQIESCEEDEQEYPINTTSAIGGGSGDGVGIGGLTTSSQLRAIHCKLKLTRGGGSKNLYWPFKQSVWFKNVQSAVHANKEVFVDGLLFQGRRIPIRSDLAYFFAQLQKGALPLTRLDSPYEQWDKSSFKLKELSIKARVLLDEVKAEINPQFNDDIGVVSLFAKLEVLFSKIEGLQTEQICRDEITFIETSTKWSTLHGSPHVNGTTNDLIIELRSKILKIRHLLLKVTILGGCS